MKKILAFADDPEFIRKVHMYWIEAREMEIRHILSEMPLASKFCKLHQILELKDEGKKIYDYDPKNL